MKCRKNTESKNPKRKNNVLSKCAVCDIKKSKFSKQQEVNGLLNSLVIKTPFSKIPLVDPFLF